MHKRNRHLVNSSSICLCYLNKQSGGTFYTVNYAYRKGLKVIVALAGAKLPGGEIKRGVIRGVESNGMICSLQELGIEEKYIDEYEKPRK